MELIPGRQQWLRGENLKIGLAGNVTQQEVQVNRTIAFK